MSRQLSITSAFCAFTMALFALAAQAGLSGNAGETARDTATPFTAFEVGR